MKTLTKIPLDMMGYLPRIMRKRDRLIARWQKDFGGIAPDVEIKDRLTLLAIYYIRAELRGPQAVFADGILSNDDTTQKGVNHGTTETPSDA